MPPPAESASISRSAVRYRCGRLNRGRRARASTRPPGSRHRRRMPSSCARSARVTAVITCRPARRRRSRESISGRSGTSPTTAPTSHHRRSTIRRSRSRRGSTVGLVAAAWSALAATGHTTATDTILIGETAPRGINTGNHPGNFSGMLPLRFIRAMYCVDSDLKPLRGTAATLRAVRRRHQAPLSSGPKIPACSTRAASRTTPTRMRPRRPTHPTICPETPTSRRSGRSSTRSTAPPRRTRPLAECRSTRPSSATAARPSSTARRRPSI